MFVYTDFTTYRKRGKTMINFDYNKKNNFIKRNHKFTLVEIGGTQH